MEGDQYTHDMENFMKTAAQKRSPKGNVLGCIIVPFRKR